MQRGRLEEEAAAGSLMAKLALAEEKLQTTEQKSKEEAADQVLRARLKAAEEQLAAQAVA